MCFVKSLIFECKILNQGGNSQTIERRIDMSLENCLIEIRANWREIYPSRYTCVNLFHILFTFFFPTPSIFRKKFLVAHRVVGVGEHREYLQSELSE